MNPVPVAVFASGGGSNLQALLAQEQSQGYWRIETVVSDRSDAGALDRARAAGREALVLSAPAGGTDDFGDRMLKELSERDIQVVLLAGYLKLVPEVVVRFYRRRILNVHPALLPAFGGKGMYGMRVHRAVVESGVRWSGVTVHYVDERYDEGTILAQWPVPVRSDDTPEELAARVLKVEHVLYPLAADALCRAVARGHPEPTFTLPDAAFTLVEGDVEGALAPTMRSAFQRTWPEEAPAEESAEESAEEREEDR